MKRSARARAGSLACVIGDISLVRALGMRGLPVAVVTEDRSAKCTRSRYCRTVVTTPSWMTEPDRATAVLIAWAERQPAPPVLFYEGDHDLLAVSRARERLARCFRFVLPDRELVEDMVDKRRFAALADRRALAVPDTMTIPEGSKVADVLRRWDRYPCVVKPAIRSNWYELIGCHQKALRIETRTGLELLLRRVEADIARFVLQECIEGGEENLLSYHAFVRPGGEIVAEFTGRKIRTSPMLFGLSTYVEITDDDEVRRLGRETVGKLGFSGVLKIDWKRDAGTGRLYMLEINPRFNLWHHPGTVAGVGIPEAVYWDCVAPDRVEPMRPARKGVRWMVPMSDLRAAREYRAAGQLSRARWLFELLTVDVNEGFRIRDPFPVLDDLARLLKRMIFRAAPKAGQTT